MWRVMDEDLNEGDDAKIEDVVEFLKRNCTSIKNN